MTVMEPILCHKIALQPFSYFLYFSGKREDPSRFVEVSLVLSRADVQVLRYIEPAAVDDLSQVSLSADVLFYKFGNPSSPIDRLSRTNALGALKRSLDPIRIVRNEQFGKYISDPDIFRFAFNCHTDQMYVCLRL